MVIYVFNGLLQKVWRVERRQLEATNLSLTLVLDTASLAS